MGILSALAQKAHDAYQHMPSGKQVARASAYLATTAWSLNVSVVEAGVLGNYSNASHTTWGENHTTNSTSSIDVIALGSMAGLATIVLCCGGVVFTTFFCTGEKRQKALLSHRDYFASDATSIGSGNVSIQGSDTRAILGTIEINPNTDVADRIQAEREEATPSTASYHSFEHTASPDLKGKPLPVPLPHSLSTYKPVDKHLDKTGYQGQTTVGSFIGAL